MHILDRLSPGAMTEDNLAYLAAIGVDYLSVDVPGVSNGHSDHSAAANAIGHEETVSFLQRAQAMAAAAGLKLFNVCYFPSRAITDNLSGRDDDIEHWLELIRAMGIVGVPTLSYNFKHGNFRTPAATGRGGAQYSTFNYAELPADTNRGNKVVLVSEDEMFANIRHFHERVMPCAEENGVTMALHPEDPPLQVSQHIQRTFMKAT